MRVFVANPTAPTDVGRTAVRRVEAAAKRLGGRVAVQVLALDSPEAAELGAAIEPTVAVGDLVIATGQPPMAGHLLRAVEAALAGDADD